MERDQLSKGTHQLEMAEGGTSQDTERNQLSEGHSPTRDGRGRDKSGHGKEPSKQGHLLSGDSRGRDKSGHRKKLTKQWALTNWKPQREGQVRTQQETDQAGGTHHLGTTEGGTSQDTERN